jgi:parvulin-like peptidyl-prolyl isomerase
MQSNREASWMTRYVKALYFAIAILPIALFSGCSTPSADNSSSTVDQGTDAVATVNGEPIDRDQMYAGMEQYVPAQLQNFPRNPLLGVTAGRVVLQRLITNELTIQLAKQSQVPVTDGEIQSRYNDVKMVKDTQSTKDFEDLLNDQGLTVAQFEDQNIKPDVAQFNLITKGIVVSDAEVQATYRAHISDYTEPDRVHIERIVLPDKASADQAYAVASKTNSLDDVLSQNIAQPVLGGENNADFAQWIQVDQPASALTPVLVACAAGQPGTILKPILVQNQWWLIKLVDRRPAQILPFDQVKHIVTWNLESTKAAASGNILKLQSEMQDLTGQSVITVKSPQYISLVKQLQSPRAIQQPPAASGGN